MNILSTTLRQYIEASGILEREHTTADIALLKEEYSKLYQKAYRKKRGESVKEITVCIPIALYRSFLEEAEQLDLSLPAFLREATKAYIDNRLLPYYPEEIRNLILQVKKVGTNVNAVCRRAHITQNLTREQAGALWEALNNLSETLKPLSEQNRILHDC